MPFLPLSISPPRATICALASRASPSPVRFSLNAGFLRFVRGSLAPRCFFVLFPAVFRAVSLFCSPRIPRFSFFFSPASDAGFSLFCAPPCISAPVSILPDAIRPFRMSIPRHRMPVFFPLYGEVRSSLLRFNPATISRPLRTSTSRLFRMSIPRH